MTMKKILVLSMMLFSVMTMNAQNEEGESSIMPKIGLNLSTLAGDKDAKLLPSYLGGFEYEFGCSDQLGLVAGVLYSEQGEKDKVNDLTLRLGYVNVPLMVQFYTVKGLALKAGAQLGFLVTKKAKVGDVKYDFDKLEAMGIMPGSFRKFDLAIPMGISYELKNFVLDARYNLGLIGIFKKDAEMEDNYRNSVIQISLGYKIPFKN